MDNMRVLLLIFVVLCALFVSNTVAKKCNSIDIRNNVTELEKLRNCTIITGYLYVVLIESNMPKDINEYSFPELREVTDLVVFYRLKHLVNLGKLFPNLAVIRGRDLLQDYALIIYEMSSLREVGLYNLKKIHRGGVRIDKNPELCYVKTVDWKRITSGHVYTGSQPYDRCPPCPAECEDSFCWNNSTCQRTVASNCHPECLDGCKGPYDNRCFLCRNVSEDDRCVPKCSPDRYLLLNMSLCLTAEACRSLDGQWFTFHNQCMNVCPPKYKKVNTTCEYCGSLCPKICNGSLISDMDTMQRMKGCTNITGALEIKIENRIPNLEKELTENLGSIEEIRDYLKVYRSTAIHSLDFLKSLHTIRGVNLEHNLFSLLIYENANLQKLWDWENLKLKILRGTFSFHYNSKLCMSEIEKLQQLTNSSENIILRRNGTDVSPLSNGDKFGCTYTNVTVRIVEVGETNVSMECEVPTGFQKTVGYLVYYRVTAATNTSIVDEDVCDVQPWATVLVSQDNAENASFVTLSWNISDLDPYTKYSFYVRHAYQQGSYSQLQQFMTLSGDPSVPKNVVAEPYASDAIRLTWVPPVRTNGNLSHYEIYGYVLDDDQNFIDQRDYCRNTMMLDYPKIKAKPDVVREPPKLNDTCSCNVVTLPPIHQDFDAICTALDRNIYMEEDWSYSRSCSRYMYEVVTSHDTYKKMQKRSGQQSANDELVHNVFSKFKRTASKESTSFVIDNLRHFSRYVILIVACNHNRTEQSQCSSVVLVSQRTGPRPGADDVHAVRVEPVDMSSVDVHWLQPDQPNAVIVNYDLEYRNLDNENSQTQKICVTRLHHQREGSRYRLQHLHPGRYRVHVRATSLAGPGNFSSYVKFEIAMPSQSVSVAAVVVTFLVLVLVVTALVCYWRYKVRRSLDNMHLIANVNPDYAGYKEDEWEIDRSNIEIYQELGKGTFGQVFSGLIKNKNMPCAVKTINEQATMHDKMEFLNEASVMKSFNEAHHVVRLLGVVSRGHCPLVIMELMARGDLKSFLRSTRDSSTSLTCSEMYRMATEIADGMAYLAAKKYVHRDLAARNCMVSSDRTVKIGDFGMTRDIYETDYYRKETRGLLPVRWMAPESLADGVFTTDSDVWSYGIVLWEIATLAEQPYQGLANEQVLQFVVSRGTLERPLQCPDLLYDIMEACWKWYPPGRPMFTDIVEKLEAHVGQDFRLVSFYHSREGEDYRMHKQELKDARIANISALPLGHVAAHWARQTDDVHFQVQAASHSPATSANSYHSPPNDYLPYPLSTSAPRFGI